MDMQTVEAEYSQLQGKSQEITNGLVSLAHKLKSASDRGDADAGEWLFNLRELALSIKQEQQQVMAVMQAVHQAAKNDTSNQRQENYRPGHSGGFLNEVEHSGFGHAIIMGAGFGIGDDLINKD